MTDETTFTPEEGDEFASLMGINEENNYSDVEESQEDLETEEEETEAPESDEEPDNSEEEEEAPQKSVQPKKKSWIQKVLSERNQLRARVAELEAKIQNNEHTTDEFLEYTKTVSKQTAYETNEVQSLLETYPESARYMNELEWYADKTGSLESAYKAFLAVNNPELYVKTFVSKQNQAKLNSGKLSPAGVAVPKTIAKKESDTLTDDDSDVIRKMMGL